MEDVDNTQQIHLEHGLANRRVHLGIVLRRAKLSLIHGVPDNTMS